MVYDHWQASVGDLEMSSSESAGSTAKSLAAIDIGANSVRMVLAQVDAEGQIDVLGRLQLPVRLGRDTFVDGRLSQGAMNAAIDILRRYVRRCHSYGVQTIQAVATSAVREAANADAFVDRVATALGLELEVLDPTEESLLTVTAVRQAVAAALDLSRRRVLVVDVGGGSTLLTILEDGVIAASGSYALGAVRLQERLATTGEPLERRVGLLRRQIATAVDRIARSLPLESIEAVVAVGEGACFAAKQVGEGAAAAPGVRSVALEAFDPFVEACARRSPEQLSRRYGVPFPDVERLGPALLIYDALLRATQVRRMFVCDVSMRDGLLARLARRVRGEEDAELAESVVRSAKTIGEKYRYDPRHAEHVATLALRLFDELRDDHRLSPRHRLLLRVAAVLHEVGNFVSSRAHHKHSYYVISNAEVFGLSRRELQLVAHVARYHRRAQPRTTHPDYMTLPRERRIAVNKLASILRVADALDRGHAQQVRDFQVERRPSELVLYVEGVVDLTLERRAIAEKADMFEDTFGMKVRVEEAVSPLSEGRRASPMD